MFISRLLAVFILPQTCKPKPLVTMHQAKECAFMTQELSAISHIQMVASVNRVKLWCRTFFVSGDESVKILQYLTNNSGHEH